MRSILLLFTITFLSTASITSQSVFDDFEGDGTITTWFGDDCTINTNVANANMVGINTSSTVMSYEDAGGQYANVRFELDQPFDLATEHQFSLKLYIPSSGLTGNQTNQISLKVQDGLLGAPWSTQSEIIKSVVLDQWQIITFDFASDNYINIDPNSPAPVERRDFNRVVIQINGEDNADRVLAYIDDVAYDGGLIVDANPVYDLLVWADEFDGQGAIDDTKWYHQTQLPDGANWYNGEIQHYTNRVENASVNNGILRITGKKETFTDQGQTKQYTSARLNSKFAFTYGRVEVMAKLPTGVGTWPAIWTLGKNIDEDGAYWDNSGFDSTPWPACGEIDIMEHWGGNQDYISSATHTPSSFGGTVNVGGQSISGVSDDFHLYVLEWYPNKLIFSVDGTTHFVYEPSDQNDDTWPFDLDQYILLNFAVLPSISPNFTEDALEVDYVRVYQSTPVATEEVAADENFVQLTMAPNPASGRTTISYQLPTAADTHLSIYEADGRLVGTLHSGMQTEGKHHIVWMTDGLEGGVYYYTLETQSFTVTKKCIVAR